jgi:hypothetical protein
MSQNGIKTVVVGPNTLPLARATSDSGSDSDKEYNNIQPSENDSSFNEDEKQDKYIRDENVEEAASEVSDGNTTEVLSYDPLYFVLSKIFISKRTEKNVAEILEDILDVMTAKKTQANTSTN